MALKRNERYPGRYSNPTTDHPQGAFKNRTAPSAQDGSYLEQDWTNDWDGFFGRLLTLAGITLNGTVDTAQNSQYFDALRKLTLQRANPFGDIAADATIPQALTNLGLLNIFRSRITKYTTAGTYNFTVPVDTYRIKGRVVGGGGGAGGSAAAKSGGGGGGGGYAEGWFDVTPGQIIPITVGALGFGGTAGNFGTAGGLSSIGSFMSASGGAYGDAGGGGTGAGGFGGTGSGGDINTVGSDGSDGTTSGAVGAGAGGGTVLGGSTRSGGTGRNSLSLGGGGAASYLLSSQSGGNGHAGIVILEY